jgi:hypothetical protein
LKPDSVLLAPFENSAWEEKERQAGRQAGRQGAGGRKCQIVAGCIVAGRCVPMERKKEAGCTVAESG